MSNEDILKNILSWMREQIRENDFSDIAVNLSIHDKNIKKIQKSITQKLKKGV